MITTNNMMMITSNMIMLMMVMILTPAVEPLLCLAEAQTPREPVKTSVNPPGCDDDGGGDCYAHKYHYRVHHYHNHYHCDHMIMIQGAGEDQCEATWW